MTKFALQFKKSRTYRMQICNLLYFSRSTLYLLFLFLCLAFPFSGFCQEKGASINHEKSILKKNTLSKTSTDSINLLAPSIKEYIIVFLMLMGIFAKEKRWKDYKTPDELLHQKLFVELKVIHKTPVNTFTRTHICAYLIFWFMQNPYPRNLRIGM